MMAVYKGDDYDYLLKGSYIMSFTLMVSLYYSVF